MSPSSSPQILLETLILHQSKHHCLQSNQTLEEGETMPTRLQKAIGAVKDQTSISLAIVNGSSNLEVAIVRATTHDDVPIEERHIYEVLQFVSSNKTHAAACARAIGRRISRTRNWMVALKSLMLVLRIFQDGDPYFPREVLHAMKQGAKILNLSNFRDESHSSPWDYTAFVRTFALYLEQRLDCFLTGKLRRRYTCKERDGCHSFRTMASESVRDMKPSMLLDRIACWQRLLDRAIATRPTGSAKINRLIQISLYAVVKESFDFYKDITEGLVLILDSFFHLQHEACVCAFEISVHAVKQFEELNEFYSLCQTIGVGRISEYPNVQTISEDSIERMEQFLKDQSSSPRHVRPYDKPLLVLDPEVRSPSSYDCNGQPDLDMRSEFGSQCSSIEDLISATETGKRPSISIDLEAYSDQFEKKYQREEPFRVSDTGSTQSLPVMNSTIDLLSLDDWPLEEEQEREQDLFDTVLLNDSTNAQHSTSSNNSLHPSLDKSWELILAESVGRLPHAKNNGLNDSGNRQIHDTYSIESESNEGWELALAGTPGPQQINQGISSNTFDASTAITLYDQPPPQSPSLNHYNPFLDDIPTTPTAHPSPSTDFGENLLGANPFSSLPPFPKTIHSHKDPFSAGLRKTQSDGFAPTPHLTQNDLFMVRSLSIQHDTFPRSSASSRGGLDKASTPPAYSNRSDPFAGNPFGSYTQKEDPFNETMHQQNLLNQQQLWLQHQHKIMARNMANM